MNGVDPNEVVRALLRAAAQRLLPIGLFGEPSTAMFRLTNSAAVDARHYVRFSPHYGPMGHALGGAIGFAAATNQPAAVLTGDASFDLMNPLRVAIKAGVTIIVVVLNDARLGLPYFGSERRGFINSMEFMQLPPWDYSVTGSPLAGGLRVNRAAQLDGAIAQALDWPRPGCFVVDVAIDTTSRPPVGARFESIDALFGAAGERAAD